MTKKNKFKQIKTINYIRLYRLRNRKKVKKINIHRTNQKEKLKSQYTWKNCIENIQ